MAYGNSARNFLRKMDPIIAGFVALGSYLVGSFSFSRMAVRLLAPGRNIENIQLEIVGNG